MHTLQGLIWFTISVIPVLICLEMSTIFLLDHALDNLLLITHVQRNNYNYRIFFCIDNAKHTAPWEVWECAPLGNVFTCMASEVASGAPCRRLVTEMCWISHPMNCMCTFFAMDVL